MHQDNQRRVYADLVALDAWHEPFSISEKAFGVFVEASFADARIGGDDPELPFTFRLQLKRALLAIHGERPLQLERDSIIRDARQAEIKITSIRQARQALASELALHGQVSPRKIALNIATDMGKSTASSEETIATIERALPEILCLPRPAGRRSYLWELEPTFANFLEGQPWNPTEAPRLAFSGYRDADPIKPAITVTLSCKLADLSISDLEPKDKSIATRLQRLGHNPINEAAAIQHIKCSLKYADISVKDAENRFQTIVLAEMFAQPEL